MQRYAVLLILGFVSFWGCDQQKRRQLVESAPSIAQNITDDAGRNIQLPNKPKRIVSLAPNITETLFAIGAADKLVARSQACDYPPEALDIAEVQTFPQLDLEQIQQTQADLLITTDEIFTPEDISQLSRIGLPTYLLHYGGIGDVFRSIRQLGQLLDQQHQADQLADSLQTITKQVADSTQNLIHYGTVILISDDPLLVAGGGGYLDSLIYLAGGKNLFHRKEEAYYRTTVEELLSVKPEYLIIPSKDDQIYGRLISTYPALYYTPADKEKRVHIIDPDLLYRPGPRLVEGLLDLTQILHARLTRQQLKIGISNEAN